MSVKIFMLLTFSECSKINGKFSRYPLNIYKFNIIKQMRIILSIVLLCLFLVDVSHAQYQNSEITTFVLVRHAEKVDDSSDPDLSPEGYKRADQLARMFEMIKIDAVYSTNRVRTTETVRKLAESNALEIKSYDAQTPEETAIQWIEEYRGDVVFISGHSNTTPAFANALLGKTHFDSSFDESDYGNLLIITVTDTGTSRLLHLRY